MKKDITQGSFLRMSMPVTHEMRANFFLTSIQKTDCKVCCPIIEEVPFCRVLGNKFKNRALGIPRFAML